MDLISESALFHDAALLPVLFDQGRAHIDYFGLILAPVAVIYLRGTFWASSCDCRGKRQSGTLCRLQ